MNLSTSLPWLLLMASAACPAQTLVINLYDYSGLTAEEITRFTGTAKLAMAHSGIDIQWVHCRGALAATAANCDKEMQANEITLRLQQGGPGSSNDERTMHLGRSIVNGEGGKYASVFVSAVRTQAAEFGVAFDLLMGYAVAHEVGHCLLGGGHSYVGLMRAAWNRKDSEAMSRLSLQLTKQQTAQAVARLSPAGAKARKGTDSGAAALTAASK